MKPKGYGDICLEWMDDDTKVHYYVIKEVLYYSKSPVNLLGIIKFGRQLDRDLLPEELTKNTSITTYPNHSIFIWDKKRFK